MNRYWRPEYWEEIKPSLDSDDPYDEFANGYDSGVEDGADAMLEKLKEEGFFTYGNHTPDIGLDDASDKSGYWCFIPEES